MPLQNSLIVAINKRIASSLDYKGRVVDLGCGVAPYKKLIQQSAAKEYVGVDWDGSPHDSSNVDVFADITKEIPLEADYADTVCSFQVMEHLPDPDGFLDECFRILKPGGRLFITTPFMWHVHEAPHDYYRFTRYGLEHLLSKHGFVDVTVTENTGFWQTWILKFNYHSCRYAIGPLRCFWIPVWFLGQMLAPILDRFDWNPRETASYTSVATKPKTALQTDLEIIS